MRPADGVAIDELPGSGGAIVVGRFRAMASPCEVLVAAPPQAARALAQAATVIAAEEAWRIEARFSRYRGDGIVRRINASAGRPLRLDDETARLIDFADRCWRLSDGLFDITSGVLRRAWRFEPGAQLPSREAVAALLERVGWQRVDWRAPVLRLRPGMEIDLGGIGKEYAVDRAFQRIAARIDAAFVVNFGGDLRVNRPPPGRAAWQIGIEADAAGAGTDGGSSGQAATALVTEVAAAAAAEFVTAGVVEIAGGACTTSGDRHRHVLHDGRRYGHLLDPRTGWPVAGSPRSVTVCGATCVETGLLSTLAMLHGENAEAFLAAQGVPHRVQR